MGMLPAIRATEPYSPMARAKASVKPVACAGAIVEAQGYLFGKPVPVDELPDQTSAVRH